MNQLETAMWHCQLARWAAEGLISIKNDFNTYGFETHYVVLKNGTLTDCHYHFPSEEEFAKVALAVKAGQ